MSTSYLTLLILRVGVQDAVAEGVSPDPAHDSESVIYSFWGGPLLEQLCLADRLIPLFPLRGCCVEVFAGGAAPYFMRPQAVPVEVLNDINGDLVTLYRVVQNHLEEFVRQFKWALSSRQVFEWQKMICPETLTDVQRAARFFYLQHHAFAGKVTGQTFGAATTGPAINLLRIEENLSAAWQRLSGTYAENLPLLEFAERYHRAHTFHYMDPPYWQTAGYAVDFPFENYERMADFIRRCKGKVMVSINDHSDIRRVFDSFTLRRWIFVAAVPTIDRGRQR